MFFECKKSVKFRWQWFIGSKQFSCCIQMGLKLKHSFRGCSLCIITSLLIFARFMSSLGFVVLSAVKNTNREYFGIVNIMNMGRGYSRLW